MDHRCPCDFSIYVTHFSASEIPLFLELLIYSFVCCLLFSNESKDLQHNHKQFAIVDQKHAENVIYEKKNDNNSITIWRLFLKDFCKIK